MNKRPAAYGETQFCTKCKRHHKSSGWYFGKTVCRKAYKQMSSTDKNAASGHDFAALVDGVDATDNSCHKIAALRFRADIQAILTAFSMMNPLGVSLSVKFWVLGYLFCLYWNWPIAVAYTLFLKAELFRIPKGKADCKKYSDTVGQVQEEIIKMLEPMSVTDGSIIIPREAKKNWETDNNFLHSYKNPSERRTADQTWFLLRKDALKGAFAGACQELADYVEARDVVSIEAMRCILEQHGCSLYRGTKKHYISIRFLRALIFATGYVHVEANYFVVEF